jgi:chitinase
MTRGKIRSGPVEVGNPPIRFAAASSNAAENAGTVHIPVSSGVLSDEAVIISENPVRVDYAVTGGSASAGSDYAPISGTLTITPGSLGAHIPVTLIDNLDDEIDRSITITLFNPTGGYLDAPVGHLLNIRDDDGAPGPSVGIALAETTRVITENTGIATFTVTLSAALSDTVTVDYATVDDTATAVEDYMPISGTLVFLPDMLAGTVRVPIVNDEQPETDETFILRLSMPVNALLLNERSTVTIRDDEVAPANNRRIIYIPLIIR